MPAAKAMPSKLLARLDSEISRTRDPVQLACLRAERAGFLGRHGQIELAQGQLHEIQRQFSQRPHVAVSGWVALAEGQIEHYTRLGSSARDRFQRAHALSAAAGLLPLQALSAAWLAHSEDARGDREGMARLCAEALRLAEADHHSARWRAALTLAGAYHFAGRADGAQRWYAVARTHAMADGDEVAMSALMYNQATLSSSEARWAAAFEPDGRRGTATAILGAESARQFDRVIGLQSLDWLVPMMRAQLRVLDEDYGEALALIDQHWPRCEPSWRHRMQAGVLGDRAWCLLKLGREDEARQDVERAVQGLQAPVDEDDLALAHARLAELFKALERPAEAARHRQAAESLAASHEAARQKLAKVLDEATAVLG